MKLKLFTNYKKLWKSVNREIASKEAVLINTDNHEIVESIEQLKNISFPIVVEVSMHYERDIMKVYAILKHEELVKIKKEMVDDVILPYFDILNKKESL